MNTSMYAQWSRHPVPRALLTLSVLTACAQTPPPERDTDVDGVVLAQAVPPPGQGLNVTYFSEPDLSGRTTTRVEGPLDFDWKRTEAIAGYGDLWSARWSGFVQVPASGTYTLITTSDDGVRVWVDGTRVIDDWTRHSAKENRARVTLSAGQRVPLRVEYFDGGLDAVMKLEWIRPGGTREVIPVGALRPGDTPPSTQEPAGPAWRERVLNGDGTIDWSAWTQIANTLHQGDTRDYLLGPKASDYGVPRHPQALYGPSAQGLLGRNDAGRCTTDLPGSDQEERDRGMKGGAWIMSGQLLFAPDPNAPGDLRYGVSNARTFDGAYFDEPRFGLCLRVRASWEADWWNRNGVSVPLTPSVAELRTRIPDLPLPPVATARGAGGASVTGFLAFQNGVIASAGTGNDGYSSEGFSNRFTRLASGKVPTAMAVTPGNEFVLVTVWDTSRRKAQLAVVAVKNRLMAQERLFRYGLPGWPTVTGLKVLGYVDLPVNAPISLDVTTTTRLGNPRGNTSNVGIDLGSQAERDRWRTTPWNTDYGDNYWKQTAQGGYAIVASRAENRVVLIDLRPLFRFYREMYFTTGSRYQQTLDEGPAAGAWPHTFEHAPTQRPVVAKVLNVPQPTAVATGGRWNSFKTPRSYPDFVRPLMIATVASLDGTVRQYDVRTLVEPATPAAVSDTPIRSFKVGRNPTRIFRGFFATTGDDLFIVSRVDRSVTHAEFDGRVRGVLRDNRLVDPVNVTVNYNVAGFPGNGDGRGVYAHVLSVMDFGGRQLVNYLVNDGMNVQGQQWPMTGPDGRLMNFQHGFTTPTFGRPFDWTVDEVI